MGSVLKVGERSITFEGSAPWEEKHSEVGEGSAAEGPTIVEGSEGEESKAITEGSRKR